MRRPRTNYPVRAILKRIDDEQVFYCKITKRRLVSTDIGQEMEATNKILTTPSDIEFLVNDHINVGVEEYTVDSVNSELDPDTNNYRNPKFITRLEIS